jgi:hypothetical protein
MEQSSDKPVAKMLGENGNVFNLIGIARRALRDAGMTEQAKEMQERVLAAKSYDEALQIMMEYVEIE